MTSERFTRPADETLRLAREEARRLGHNYVGTEHVLLGLLCERRGVAARVLSELGLTLQYARERTAVLVGPAERTWENFPQEEELRPTPRLERILRRAQPEAWRLGAAKAGTEHLLLALIGDPDGLAVRILADSDIQPQRLKAEVMKMAEDGQNDGITAEELREESQRFRQAADAMNEAMGKSFTRIMLSALASSLMYVPVIGITVYVTVRLALKKRSP